MSQSIGGLYLQLKLETGGIERDLSRVGKVLSAQVNGRQLAREMQQGLGPVIRAYRESARSLAQSTSELAKALDELGKRVPRAVGQATGATSRGAGAARTAAKEVENSARAAERAAKEQARAAEKAARDVERAEKDKARAAEKAARDVERAEKEKARAAEKAAREVQRAEKEKARAAAKAAKDAQRAADAAAKAAARQAAADVRAAQQAQRAEERRTAAALRDAKKREEAAARAAAREAAEAQKAAKAAQDAAAKVAASRTSMFGALGAGSQELFVGLGAARSGNIFYGLAAFARYFKNVGAAAKGMSIPVVGATAAIVGVGLVALVAGGSLAYLTKQLTEMGIASATNLQFLKAQLSALIGNSREAAYEFQWLLDLGKESIVPTSDLIEADRTLLAYGISLGKLRRDLVQFISDWGSATGATQVQVGNLSFALGQVASTGKVTAIDLRQIGNAGINTAALLEILADRAGKSVTEVREDLTSGKFAAQDFYDALIEYGDRFKKGAERTANTVKGLRQNIEEAFVTGIGEAFLKSGVLKPITDFLKDIQQFLKQNPEFFKPLADSIRYFLDALGGVRSSVQSSGTDIIVKLFQEWIPNAIITTAEFILYAIEAFKALQPMFENVWNGFLTLWGVVKVVMPGIGMMVAIVGSVFATLALTWTNILNILSTAFQIAASAAVAFWLAMTGDLAGAKEALFGIKDIVVEATTTTVDAFMDYFTTLWNLSQIPLMELPAFNPPEWPEMPKPPRGGINEGFGEPVPEIDEEAISKMEDALKRIAELTRRFMGQRSELEEALLGGRTGFTASIDSIYSATKQYVDLVKEALPAGGARSSLIEFLKTEAAQLVKLARERDRIARRLEQAQQRLKDIIADRRSFKESIRETIKGFVMNSRLDTEEETLMRRLDSVGSFVQKTITTSKLFVDSMRERLQAVREFVRNIRTLQEKGLDANLVRSFIEAGPDAAADAVKQLAESNDATIREVNDMQRSLDQLAMEFADEQGDIYYDAGQDAAQSLVDSLRGQLQAIRQAAVDIAEAMRAALASLPDDMSAIGQSTGTALGQGTTAAWEEYLRNYDWQAAVDRIQPQTTFKGPRRAPDPTPAPVLPPAPTPAPTPAPAPNPTNPIQLPTVQQAVDSIVQFLKDVANALAALGDALWPLNFPNLFKMLIGVAPDVKKVVDDVKNFLIQLGAEIRQRGDKLWPDDFSIPGFWDLLLKGMPLAGDAIQNIKTFLSGVAKQIGERASKLWPDNFSPKAIWDVLLRQFPVVSEINQKIKGLLSAAWAYIKEQGARLWPDGFDMKAVWEGLATGFPSVTDGLLKIREWIANLLTRLSKNPGKTFDFMESVWENLLKGLPKFSAIKSAFAQFIESVKITLSQGLQSILDLWNNATFNFPGFNFSIDVDLPGGKRVSAGLNFAAFSLNTPDIKLADGGLVNRPVMATVGEAGEEAVLPLTNKATMARIADAIGVETGNAETNIDLKVFIGERDITDIVDSRISYRDQASARAVLSGRRI